MSHPIPGHSYEEDRENRHNYASRLNGISKSLQAKKQKLAKKMPKDKRSLKEVGRSLGRVANAFDRVGKKYSGHQSSKPF